jgi:hypothetical protein
MCNVCQLFWLLLRQARGQQPPSTAAASGTLALRQFTCLLPARLSALLFLERACVRLLASWPMGGPCGLLSVNNTQSTEASERLDPTTHQKIHSACACVELPLVRALSS